MNSPYRTAFFGQPPDRPPFDPVIVGLLAVTAGAVGAFLGLPVVTACCLGLAATVTFRRGPPSP